MCWIFAAMPDSFREAKGRPITADEIAVQAMKDKNLDIRAMVRRGRKSHVVHVDVDADVEDRGMSKQWWGADARGVASGDSAPFANDSLF